MLSLARFSLDVQYTIRFTAAMVISVVCVFGLFGLAALAFWPFETHDRYGTWDVFAVRAMSNAERFDLEQARNRLKEEQARLKFVSDVDAFIADHATFDPAAGVITFRDQLQAYDEHMQGHLYEKSVRDAALRRIRTEHQVESLGTDCSMLQFRWLDSR